MVRQTLTRVLQERMETLEAASGEEALAVLEREGGVPVILTDLYMPGLDGLQLVRRVRESYPDTSVLVITGVADVPTAVEAFQLGAVDYLAKPVMMDEVRQRVGNAIRQRRLVLENRWLQETEQARLQEQVEAMARRQEEMFLGQVHMAVRMLEAKDEYTRGHSQRVASYAIRTAEVLGVLDEDIGQIRLGGELHDIGKIGTRDAVLNKPGPLTPEEFDEVKRHVVVGEEMLEPLRADHPAVLQIVRWHHEHVDGSGFPDGLTGEAIPLAAKIVSVADAFDAMTTSRAYREPRPPKDAMFELDRCVGTQFDGRIIEAFHRAFPDVASLPTTGP